MAEIYVSTDIETDGQIPGVYSMLSLGSAAFDAGGNLLSTFSANLETLPDAIQSEETMTWWATQPEAWAKCRENLRPPVEAMKEYVAWLEGIKGQKVFVGYPTGFDFTFVYWYLIRFAGKSPFGFSALDMKTFAMALLPQTFRGTSKKTMPKEWFGESKHSHVAVEDAIEQGELFFSMLRERDRRLKG
jgi:DNA polymerase III alpha subunit (gram-positive type)